MNKTRRAELARAVELLNEAREVIQGAAGEEREAFDNLSESLQGGERGLAMEAAADALDSAESGIDEAIGYVEEAAA